MDGMLWALGPQTKPIMGLVDTGLRNKCSSVTKLFCYTHRIHVWYINIYLHLTYRFKPDVGKYNIPYNIYMDPVGYVVCFFFCGFAVKTLTGLCVSQFLFWIYFSTPRPSLQEFHGTISDELRKKLQQSSQGMYTKQKLPNGRVRVTGGKRLKESGAYAPGFGKHVAKLMSKQRLKVPCIYIICIISNWELPYLKNVFFCTYIYIC